MTTSSSRARLVLGTAGLGLPYGARTRSDPDPERALRVIREALDAGVHRFDTAPAYGTAERLLGQALRNDGEIWTKLTAQGAEQALRSVEASSVACCRMQLDLAQWHNWTADLLKSKQWTAAHEALRTCGRVRGIGASTYGVADAIAAVRSGLFSVVQVEWNLLNQAVVRSVADDARAQGVQVAARSVLLQGVLTQASEPLPARLAPLEHMRGEVARVATQAGRSIQHLALRAALDTSGIDYVLVGAQSTAELLEALVAADSPPLDSELLAACQALDRSTSSWVDPRQWPPA